MIPQTTNEVGLALAKLGRDLVSCAIVRGLVREMKTLQSRIDVGRTLGAGIRKETELGGYGRQA